MFAITPDGVLLCRTPCYLTNRQYKSRIGKSIEPQRSDGSDFHTAHVHQWCCIADAPMVALRGFDEPVKFYLKVRQFRDDYGDADFDFPHDGHTQTRGVEGE